MCNEFQKANQYLRIQKVLFTALLLPCKWVSKNYQQKLPGPCTYIIPALDKLLASSLELITNNSDCELGIFSDSGLDRKSKILKYICKNLSRKNFKTCNLGDSISCMWVSSDLKINVEMQKSLPQGLC